MRLDHVGVMFVRVCVCTTSVYIAGTTAATLHGSVTVMRFTATAPGRHSPMNNLVT